MPQSILYDFSAEIWFSALGSCESTPDNIQPCIEIKASLKHPALSEWACGTCFEILYQCPHTASRTCAKVFVSRLSVPTLTAVGVIYDVGVRLLIYGVSCPAGICSCIIFFCVGKHFSSYISSVKTGTECRPSNTSALPHLLCQHACHMEQQWRDCCLQTMLVTIHPCWNSLSTSWTVKEVSKLYNTFSLNVFICVTMGFLMFVAWL